MRTTFSVAVLGICLLVSRVHADDQDPPAKPAPAPAVLDETYLQVRQHVTDHYIETLPAGWAAWQNRFTGKLTSTGALRGVLDVMLSSPEDRQLRILTPKEAEQYLARQAAGYVGMGIEFEATYTLNEGFKVEDVLKDSPAKAANVPSGSTIVAINGERLAGRSYVDALLALLSPDTTMKLTLKDGEKETEVTIIRKPGQKLGIQFAPGPTTFREHVKRVFKGSPAEAAGIKAGDEVTHLHGHPIVNADPQWFNRSATYGDLGSTVTMTFKREAETFDREIARGVVHNQDLAYQFSDGTLRLINLDWRQLPQLIDQHISDIEKAGNLTIDLRGASGDNPEVAARIAARFIAKGDLIAFIQRDAIAEKLERCYFVEEKGDKTTLFIQNVDGHKLNSFTQVEEGIGTASSAKLTVLVDEYTSGTAEALALALQSSGRATVSGTKTAGRNNVVSTKVFKADDAEFYIEVPTGTLVSNAKNRSIAVTPETVVPAGRASLTVISVAGLLLIGCCAVWWVVGALRNTGQVRRMYLSALLGFVTCSAVFWYVFDGKEMFHALLPKTDAQKAAAYISNILRTDEDAKSDHLKYAHVERGPKDAKPDNWSDEQKGIAPAEIDAACRIVTAMTEGDAESLRRIVASYVYMPYARAQIASSLNYTFHLAGGVDHRLDWYGEGRFGIDRSDLIDGKFGVSFSALNEEPLVSLMVRDPKYPSQFSSDQSDLVTPEEAMMAIKLSFVREILARQAEKNATK